MLLKCHDKWIKDGYSRSLGGLWPFFGLLIWQQTLRIINIANVTWLIEGTHSKGSGNIEEGLSKRVFKQKWLGPSLPSWRVLRKAALNSKQNWTGITVDLIIMCIYIYIIKPRNTICIDVYHILLYFLHFTSFYNRIRYIYIDIDTHTRCLIPTAKVRRNRNTKVMVGTFIRSLAHELEPRGMEQCIVTM